MTSIATFVSQENSVNGRGANGIPLEYNAAGSAAAGSNLGTIAPPAGQNAVIGFQSAAFTGGCDVVLLDGPRANYAIQVNSSGVTTVQDIGSGDATFGQTIIVSGASYILFDGAHIALSDPDTPAAMTTPSGSTTPVLNYPNDIYFIRDPANAQLAQFYSALLPWEPQPALAGFEYWETRLAQGMSLSSIAQSFINTDYFQQTFGDPGTTHAQHLAFVETVYKSILGMNLDATNSGVQYWVTQMDNVATTGMDGAHTLISFTNATASTSLINATAGATAGAGTGWLINYAVTGGYADPGAQQSVQSVFQAADQSHYLNTSLIDTSSITGAHGQYIDPSSGNAITLPQTIGGTLTGQTYVSVSSSSTTVQLSPTVNEGFLVGSGNTMISSPSGGSSISISGNNDTVILHGTGNAVMTQSNGTTQPLNNSVVGYLPGNDNLVITAGQGTPYNAAPVLLSSTAGAPVQGSALNFGTTNYYINVGTLSDNTAATMAAAANKVYTVAGTQPSYNYGFLNGENITFYGQVGSDTVIYVWGHINTSGTGTPCADANNNHLVDTGELATGLTLLGVQATSLTAKDFTFHF